MRSRLQQLFGPASPWVLQPQRSGLACGVLWLLSLPLTWHHPWLSLLGFIAIWGLTIAMSLEAGLLEFLPLPPLTVLLIGFCLRWGLGPLLLAVGGSGGDAFVAIWIRYGPQAQLLWLTLTFFLLLLALLQKRAIAHAAQSLPFQPLLREVTQKPRLRSQITTMAGLLSLYMAAYIILSMLSGSFDRQFDTYVTWTHRLWRLDTPVSAFSRLRDFWFLLFPLWWRLLARPWRWVLGAEMLAFFCLALLSGSRGLLFYPILLLAFGLWFVIEDARVLRRLAAALFATFFVLSPIIYLARQTPSFETADGLEDRIRVYTSVLQRPDLLLDKTRWFGRDLYACHDPYLFTPDNSTQSRVGFSGLGSIAYLWTPKHLHPTRPVIFDGHLIAKQLQRVKPNDWSKVWFPCISFPADLMRRWGVPGVFLGSLLVACIFQLLFRLWYRLASISGSTFQLFLWLLPATYLQSLPLGTVSETAWGLLWELPKYLVLFWLLGSVVDRFLLRVNN